MSKLKSFPEAQNPLILRLNRLMEAFAKSDDERDFYLDRVEGFIIFVDLDKPEESLSVLEKEIARNKDRYCLIPKMTFYETKKIMESFVNEKVYDIDTKEKLLDIIQSKEARENFLEFIYDQHTELDKWQQFYQERSRIRIIEWLRNNHFHFVFEEDLELGRKLVEKLKENLFEAKPPKEILNARKTIFTKAKTYYSNEALNPRPKRGRPPKQTQKQEIEPQVSADIYTTVSSNIRQFLFTPDISGVSAATFSAKYESEEELLEKRGLTQREDSEEEDELGDINKKLASLRALSNNWIQNEDEKTSKQKAVDKVPPAKEPLKKKEAKKPLKRKTKDKPPKDEKKRLRTLRKTTKKTKAQDKNEKESTPAKKRIIPKSTDTAKKRPIRKIIPTTPKSKSKKPLKKKGKD